MATITAVITWQRGSALFTDNRYSRRHTWEFDGGVTVPASSSPHVVPVPMSDASAVDPEEALVAALSSCHMLSILYVAAKRGLIVDDYRDDAVGKMGKNSEGRIAVTSVTLRPVIKWMGQTQPDNTVVEELHHAAHEQCFIANSVKTDVRIEPVFEPSV